MKSTITIKDKKVTSNLDLEDGVYAISITKKGDEKSLEQVKKLWATCSDIAEALYGLKSEKDKVYMQILKMAGVRTYKLVLEENALETFMNNRNVKCVSVLSREVVNHRPMALVEVCMTGISEMDKKEVSRVIEECCRYAVECGIEPQVRNYEG